MFSLTDLVDVDEDGVYFRSHLDGSLHRFTPEVALQIQMDLTEQNIVVPLDQCIGFPASSHEERIGQRGLFSGQESKQFFSSPSSAPFRYNPGRDG